MNNILPVACFREWSLHKVYHPVFPGVCPVCLEYGLSALPGTANHIRPVKFKVHLLTPVHLASPQHKMFLFFFGGVKLLFIPLRGTIF